MAKSGVKTENGTFKLPKGVYLYKNTSKGKPGDMYGDKRSLEEGTKVTYSKKYTSGDWVYYFLPSQGAWFRLSKDDTKNLGSGSTAAGAKYGYNTVSISVKVSGNGMNVYSLPQGGPTIGVLKKGAKVTFTRKYQQCKGASVYMHYTSTSVSPSSGWVKYEASKFNKGTKSGNMTVTANNTKAAVNSTNSNTLVANANDFNTVLEESSGVFTAEDANYLDIGAGATTDYTNTLTANDLISDSIRGIMCAPYQFMAIADRRLNGASFGRKYAEKIVSRMPLLYLTPGRPAFMADYDKDTRDNMLKAIVGTADKALAKSAYNEFINDNGKFYSFDFRFEEYFRYVNPLLQIIARLMGIENKTVKLNKKYSTKLKKADWSRALSDDFRKYWSAAECIPFYIDSSTQITESFSNDTTESSFASKVNSVSEKAAEMNYLLGLGGSLLGESKIANYISDFQESIKDIAGGSSSSLLDKLSNSAATIGSGGRLVFPEVWSDSSFSRSYNIDIKLRSPDCDNLSIFMNIMVPFIHLLCLAAPQQLSSNGYQSPFIVRGFYKGMFNIDMGIITSMEVTKGKEAAWNINGIPTQMDISLTIKDLYNELFISGLDESIGIGSSVFYNKANDSVLKIIKNTSMIDYLANTAGLNLNKPELARNVQLYLMLKSSQIKNWPHTKWLKFQQGVDKLLAGLYSI